MLHRAGPFPTTKANAQAAGWADRYTVQGFATVGGRLWRYTGDGTGTNRYDPAALTEYDWKSGGEVARQRTEGHRIPRAGHPVGARGLDDQHVTDLGVVRGRTITHCWAWLSTDTAWSVAASFGSARASSSWPYNCRLSCISVVICA